VGSSGYSTAILRALGVSSVSDGMCDLAVINGAIEEIPDEIAATVKEGGRIAAFVQADGRGYAALFRKQGGEWSETPLFDAFVPLLDGFEARKGFTF
jgi:protein-L-isoaspartate(D-aspartate) O-methyltransferase